MKMKPEEIAKALEFCVQNGGISVCPSECPYKQFEGATCVDAIMSDAAEAIKALLSERDAMMVNFTDIMQKLLRERDTAIEQLRGVCTACKHLDESPVKEPCLHCSDKNYECWEWCGIKESKP